MFEFVGAKPHHGFILKMFGDAGNIISSAEKLVSGWESLAERKVKEVKLPVVGDELIFNLESGTHKYKVIAINDKSVAVLVLSGINEGHYDSFNILALSKCEIIDQSKRPNPVNMVEEKWVPKVGDKFRVRELNVVDWLCVEVDGLNIKGVECVSPNSIPTTIVTSCYSFRKL